MTHERFPEYFSPNDSTPARKAAAPPTSRSAAWTRPKAWDELGWRACHTATDVVLLIMSAESSALPTRAARPGATP